MTRRPVVYHIIAAGRRHVSAASELVVRERRVAVELDPGIVKTKGVFVEIDPTKLRTLDEDGWVFGYPEIVDRRSLSERRNDGPPSRMRGRRVSDREMRSTTRPPR